MVWEMKSPVSSKTDVFDRLHRAKDELLSLGVSGLGLFGSFVKGCHTPESDVDILVEFQPGKHGFDAFMDLSFFLEDLLGRPVELLTRESLSPYIGPEILREMEHVQVAA